MQDILSAFQTRTQDAPAVIKAEPLIELLLSYAFDASLVVSEEGVIVGANSEAYALFGYGPGELVGMDLEALLPERYREEHREKRLKYIQDPTPRVMSRALEVSALRKDGTEFRADVTLRPIHVESSVFVLCSLKDVTQRVQAERALRESARRLSAIFNSTFQFIGLMSPDGILLEANKTALDFAGSRIEDETGRHFWECSWWRWSPEAQNRLQEAIARAATGEFVRYEDIVAGEGGNRVYVDFSIKPMFDDEGHVVMLIPEARDISERKRAEESLAHRDAILQAVGYAAEQFLAGSSLDESVGKVLSRLGAAAGVSRVHIFENAEGSGGVLYPKLRYEWAAPGIVPLRELLQGQVAGYDKDGFGRWAKVLGSGEVIRGETADLPPSEAKMLARAGVRSLVVFPVFVHGKWWGFMGFDECGHDRIWTDAEIEALRIAANTFSAAIQRTLNEIELRASQDRFAKAFHLAPVATVILRLSDTRVIDVNQAFVEATGYSKEEVTRKKFSWRRLLVQPREFDEMIEKAEQVGSSHSIELRFLSKRNEVRDMLASADRIDVDGEPCLLVMFYDITERKRLQREIARLTAHEQRQISYDLHEDLAQQLASTALLSGVQLRKLQEEGSHHAERMARIAGMIGDAVAYSRDLSQRLSPVDFHPEGLTYALRGLAESTSSMLGIPCYFEVGPPVLVQDNDVATHVYRIAQDAIRNAVRNGSPQNIDLGLKARGSEATLQIRIAGVAPTTFLSDDAAYRRMEYRVDLIQGSLIVSEGGPESTRVEVRIPLEKAPPEVDEG
jgi:PAS domain S-box-containing protein